MDRSDKLQKLYFRIGEVASIVGVEPHVLRYWESEFRSIRPQKSARGQRIYSRRDVDTLLKVKELLYAHRFTIAGAKRKLREGGVEPIGPEPTTPPAAEGPSPVPAEAARELERVNSELSQASGDLVELRVRLEQVRARAVELRDSIEAWSADASLDAAGTTPDQRLMVAPASVPPSSGAPATVPPRSTREAALQPARGRPQDLARDNPAGSRGPRDR
ncbi:MAG: MerR family transcriptional regulator [Polyangiaceae bacterium]